MLLMLLMLVCVRETKGNGAVEAAFVKRLCSVKQRCRLIQNEAVPGDVRSKDPKSFAAPLIPGTKRENHQRQTIIRSQGCHDTCVQQPTHQTSLHHSNTLLLLLIPIPTMSTMTSSKRWTLLLVDVQKDFHPPHGSLAIPKADEDAARIAAFIRQHGAKIDRIVATLDSHHKLHIANPCAWQDPVSGKPPPPFTLIHHDDIVKGKWVPHPKIELHPKELTAFPHVKSMKEYVLEYTKALEAKGRFVLCIWPEHCLIGTDGHAVVDTVREAMNEWSNKTGRSPEFVHKGMNNYTEMYSALEAEVVTNDETGLNKELMASMRTSEALLVCGQAMSHCVNYTLRDIVQHWDDADGTTTDKKPIFLLTDCGSAVPSFEAAATTFEKDMGLAGVTLCKSTDF